MSLFSSIGKALRSGVSSVLKYGGAILKSPVGKVIPGLGTAATVASVAGAVGSLGAKAVKTGARVIPGKGIVGKAGTVGIGTAAYQSGKSTGRQMAVVDQQGNIVGYTRKRRRMDYGNVKAAKRAGRRIKGTIKLLHNLEKSLPHKVVHRRSTSRASSCR